MAEPTDREIRDLVVDAIRLDSRIDLSEIDIRVENGVIYLSGEVDSAAERLAVQENINTVFKSPRVIDQLALKNYIARSDYELQQAVKANLIRDITVDANPILVAARDGVVTLNGMVTSYSQKTTAEGVALWTPGVADVINHLEVDGNTEPPDDPDY